MPVLLEEKKGKVTTLTLNRPERANALNDELVGALVAAIEAVERSEETAVLVLTGSGGNFCSGADIQEIKKGSDGLGRAVEGYVALVGRLAQFSKPLLVGVDGGAVGGGLGLVALGDMVVATTRARFRTPELHLGVFPFIVSPLLIPIIGRKRFFEMVYTAQAVPAVQAKEWGLVNEIVEPDQLATRLVEIAKPLSEAPLAALQRGKRGINRGASFGELGEELLKMFAGARSKLQKLD